MKKTRALLLAGPVLAAALSLGATVPASAAQTPAASRIAPAATRHAEAQAGYAPEAPAARRMYAEFVGNSCVRGLGGKPYECVAVGTVLHGPIYLGLVESSNGGEWAKTSSVGRPSAPNDVTEGQEVSCAPVSRKLPDCMMVGVHYNFGGAVVQVAEWGGPAGFRIVDASNPARAKWSNMQDVSCPSTKFCLIVGSAGPNAKTEHATAYSWNGRSVRPLSVPAPPHARWSELAGLSCPTIRTCVAVGNYTNPAGHWLAYSAIWHEGKWKLVGAPSVSGQTGTLFSGVSCPTAGFCMAAGEEYRGSTTTQFAQVWNGSKWKLLSLPAEVQSALYGASCPTLDTCFAAGWSGHLGLIEEWSRSGGWSVMKTVRTSKPANADEFLHLSCVSAASCSAVGFSYNPAGGSFSNRALGESWNGKAWTLQAAVNS
jgi:hypothetical protein